MKNSLLVLIVISPLSNSEELNTFRNGELADADKINENFGALDRQIQANKDKLTILEGFQGTATPLPRVVDSSCESIGWAEKITPHDGTAIALHRLADGKYIRLYVTRRPTDNKLLWADGTGPVHFSDPDCTGTPYVLGSNPWYEIANISGGGIDGAGNIYRSLGEVIPTTVKSYGALGTDWGGCWNQEETLELHVAEVAIPSTIFSPPYRVIFDERDCP